MLTKVSQCCCGHLTVLADRSSGQKVYFFFSCSKTEQREVGVAVNIGASLPSILYAIVKVEYAAILDFVSRMSRIEKGDKVMDITARLGLRN